MRIGLIPADDRPVTSSLPAMIATVAGAEVALPPDSMLGHGREPGRPEEIADWLAATAPDLDALVVSLEMLAYGGLIPSRITAEPPSVLFARLAPLVALTQARPRLRPTASSVVLRASDSYSDAEEPVYWSRFGRDLHRFGGALHRNYSLDTDDAELRDLRAALPAEIRRDFLLRRLRNHILNLEAIRLVAANAVEFLALTSDDTAIDSAGSLEQLWLEHWAGALDCGDRLLFYPGADEVGAVLIARALSRDAKPVRFAVACTEPDGLERVASFENVPVRQTIARQIAAAGGVMVMSEPAADVILVVHAPSPLHEDWYGRPPTEPDAPVIAAVAEKIARLLDTGTDVALADVRYVNGSDPWLVDAIKDRCDLLALSAYAGWNTAGNSLGTAIAHATAVVSGRRGGTLDAAAHRRLLAHRYAEDCVYQTRVRAALAALAASDEEVASFVAGQLAAEMQQLLPGEAVSVASESVHLPWHRVFEVDFELVLG